mgnify:CR=1 FL=1
MMIRYFFKEFLEVELTLGAAQLSVSSDETLSTGGLIETEFVRLKSRVSEQ